MLSSFSPRMPRAFYGRYAPLYARAHREQDKVDDMTRCMLSVAPMRGRARPRAPLMMPLRTLRVGARVRLYARLAPFRTRACAHACRRA